MKLKCTTLLIAATFFLVGCSESENKAPQQKSPTAAAEKQRTLAAPKQETKTASIANQPEPPIETALQNKSKTAEEELIQEAKLLADALTYEGDETPREQVEKEIKEVLEAVMADLSEREKGDTNKQ
ncbi:MAG: hypothetical protein L3J26_13295 [Candidatus Polarisedimenticolaceae bacterium]|nr:hypothetical protein [Candidatus Polarisedimenticolaceae bacterium]